MVKKFSIFLKAIIIFSIFELLIEELSIILFLPYKIRFALIFLGFLFDTIFIFIFLLQNNQGLPFPKIRNLRQKQSILRYNPLPYSFSVL